MKMKRHIITIVLALITVMTASAQRKTDQLDRGLVAVKVSNGVFVSWRQQADEYYDVTYNLYRNGTKVNATPLSVTNYTDTGGNTSSTYTVKAVVKGVEQEASAAKTVWANDYLEITPKHPSGLVSTYVPNDACAADVDGDGQVELLMKFDNTEEINNSFQKNGWYGEHTLFEILELDGTVKWWVNCGPNMGDFQNNEQNIVGYDWDQDGKAEVIMRLEEGSTIHMANGTTYQIGADGQNGTAWTNYREPRYVGNSVGASVALAFGLSSSASISCDSNWVSTKIENGIAYATTTALNENKNGRGANVSITDNNATVDYWFGQNGTARSVEWFTHYGKEFLVYCNGETGEIYDIIDFPCARFESNETNLNDAWGDGYGHRSSKYFYGAPFLDGRNPSIFVGRGIYTRHKFVALDVDKNTHKLSERWRWMNNQKGSPWYGQGYHNYAIVDVDWDGRDEIVFGGIVIDDNGKGLSTVGLGHGDAQHHGDLNPYKHGAEGWFANEDSPNNHYRDLTTGQIYYRNESTNDDGRAIAGNFSNEIPGSIASSAHDSSTPISLVAYKHVTGYSTAGMNQNFNCYWDGDLCEETFNYLNGKNTEGAIAKFGSWTPIKTLTGSMTNNDTKGTPCFMGDILGDWRHEFVMRTAENKIRIYTTTYETPWRVYSMWYDHQQRNAMVWQMCGYNQPPHTSYFLGEMEGITAAPPALTMTGRTEIANGGTITTTDNTIISCETNDMTINVTDGASPYIYIDNAPSWVQGSAPSEATSKDYTISYKYYTHTLTGGAFTGSTRLVKQGDGMLVLPKVNQTYNGATEVWAGSLAFSGTMPNSEVWMNRHTNLYTAGTFTQPVTMEYGSTLYICDNNATGDGSLPEAEYTSANFKTLNLHEGARVAFNVNKSMKKYDVLNVENLNLRTQNWEFGPDYLSPVFEINNANSKITVGTYPLCNVENINGDISDIVIESATGFANNTKRSLENVDGVIYLNVSYENELYIGSKYNISSIWTEFSPSYTIAKGETYNFKFVNYGDKKQNQNWILAAVNGDGHSTADRADYAEYFSLVADGTALAPGHATEADNVTVNKDWTDMEEFIADMEEADVDVTVSYSNDNVLNVSAVMTATDGHTYNYTAQYSGCTADDMTLFFTVDHSHMTYPEATHTENAANVKMTYVDYNNADTSYGEVPTAQSGYNNAGSTVGFPRTDWGANWITYLQVDLSEYKNVNNVTLKFKGSGSTDNKRSTRWGVGYNASTWTSDMTYNTADKSITLLGNAVWGSTKSSTTYEDYTFDISNAYFNDDDKKLTIIIYELEAAGGYVTSPEVIVNSSIENEMESDEPTEKVIDSKVLFSQDFEDASTIDEYWTTGTAGRYASAQTTLGDESHYCKYNAGSTNGATFTYSALNNVGEAYTTTSTYTLDFDFAVIPVNGSSSSGGQTPSFTIYDKDNSPLCHWQVTTEARTAAANSTGTFYLGSTETGTFTANVDPYWYHINISASSNGTVMTVTDIEGNTSEQYTLSDHLIYIGKWTYYTAKNDGGLCLDDITLTANAWLDLTLSPTVAPVYAEGIYQTVKVDRNFNIGYSTLCLPFNMSVETFTGGDTDAYVAYLSDVQESNGVTSLYFVNMQMIEANKPCIIYLSKPLDAPTFSNIAVHSPESKTFTGGAWSMYGNYTPGFSMYGKYGVAHNAQIKKGGAASTLNAYSAYLVGPAATNAKIMFGEYVEEEDITGISDISNETTTQSNGKYADNQQIIILHNGKKYRINGTLIK